MSAAKTIGEVIWDVARRAAKHSRKRAPGDEDHWYPRVPAFWGLVENQCLNCKQVLPGKPPRGCPWLQLAAAEIARRS